MVSPRGILIILALATSAPLASAAAQAVDGESSFEREGVRFRAYVCKPDKIRLLWKDEQGNNFGDLAAAREFLGRSGQKPEMLINGGIFEPGGIPSGLLVAGGKQLNALNLREGQGNFYLRPNGVFAIVDGKARVMESTAYDKAKLSASEAVQSGPLLLQAGKVHPAFRADSANRLHRHGVGVRGDGQVLFLITDPHAGTLCNLHSFAMAFREQGCQDALFLDGDISQMWTGPGLEKPGARSNAFGSIIAVVR